MEVVEMTDNKNKNEKENSAFSGKGGDSAIRPVPLEKRTSWLTPAIIYSGCEFTISVCMVGAMIIGSYSLKEFFLLTILALVIITWAGNAINSYLGAMTGRPSSVITRSSFGVAQSRVLVAFVVMFNSGAWWALQTAITGNAMCPMFHVDYTTQYWPWALVTIACGIIFAIPAVLGYTSMAWTDYIAVPGGILVMVWGLWLAVKDLGWAQIFAWNPVHTITWITAISLLLGPNICQWMMLSDYSRYCRPRLKDSILMPFGVVITGFAMFSIGAILAIGKGEWDLIKIMVQLGFPAQAFILLFLAQWTTQLVNNYSLGLALCNMFNIESDRGRAIMTLLGAVGGIIAALLGVLSKYQGLLLLFVLLYPPIASIMATDFLLIRNKEWYEIPGWNIMATISLIVGILVGYCTQNVIEIGIPAVQSFIITGAVYYCLMRLKAKIKPDCFTPQKWASHKTY